MPQHKSARKRLRTSERQRLRNRVVTRRVRNVVKDTRQSDDERAPEKLQAAYSALDRAAKKGVIPAGRAARLKSRLARRRSARATA